MQLSRISSVLAIAAALLSAVQTAEAQLPGQLSAKEKRKQAQEKYKTTEIQQAVNIPNVPAYPAQKGGIKFIRGLKYSSLGQGNNCIVQTFLLKDPPDVVREFYNQQLAANRWFVQPANPAGTQILARRVKEGASVHVMVSPSAQKSASAERKAYLTTVQIRYVQWEPLPEE